MLNPDICVNSGIQSAIVPELNFELNEFGEWRADLSNISVQQQSLLSETILGSVGAPTVPRIADSLWSSSGDDFDPIIGWYSGLYAGHVQDMDLRMQATSGGITTWILCRLLETGKVDGVIHMRQRPTGSGPLFEYVISTTVEEVRERAKTRYYPGVLSEVARQIVAEPTKKYAIVGIPGIIAECRLATLKDPGLREQIPYMVGLLCAHQKTTKYAEALIHRAGFSPEEVVDMDFRKKLPDHKPGTYLTSVSVDKADKRITRLLPQSTSLVGNWGQGLFKSRQSDFSEDAFNLTADVSLGDAWLPPYTADPNGNNVVIVRNPLIDDLLKSGVSAGVLSLTEMTVKDIERSQPGLIRNTVHELPFRLAVHGLAVKGTGPITDTPAKLRLPPTRAAIQVYRMCAPLLNRRIYRNYEKNGDMDGYFSKATWFRRLYVLSALPDKALRVLGQLPSKAAFLTKPRHGR